MNTFVFILLLCSVNAANFETTESLETSSATSVQTEPTTSCSLNDKRTTLKTVVIGTLLVLNLIGLTLLNLKTPPSYVKSQIYPDRTLLLLMPSTSFMNTTYFSSTKYHRNRCKTNSYCDDVPIITDSDGVLYERDIHFSFEKQTEIQGACSVNFRNQNYLYGGWSQRSKKSVQKARVK